MFNCSKILFFILIFITSVNIFANEEDLENDIFLEVTTGENFENNSFDSLNQIKISNKNSTEIDVVTSNIEYKNMAKIIVLNKITSLSKEIIIKIGEAKYFGNIQIKVHKCASDLDIYKPNNLILISVIEHNIEDENIDVFNGWLMSRSFSLSSLEHPIYEIFAQECF